jgi:hypothetical protein
MFMVSYVVLDDILNYYPIVKFSNTLEKAQEVEAQVQEELERQSVRMEELFYGKILSETYLQEVDFKIYVSED